MSFIPLTTAHGALGIWDEVLPIVVAIIFTLVVLLVWLRSRRFTAERDEPAPPPDDPK